MTVTIEFNEKEQAIFREIFQKQQAVQSELNRTAQIVFASKGYDLNDTVRLAEDLKTATIDIEEEKESE